MNIDSYKAHVQQGLQRLEQLVTNIYDIIQRRVEKNLRIGSRTLLVDLPADESFTVMDFVAMRKSHIGEKGGTIQGKNVEIEHAVDDLVKIIVNYQFDTTTEIAAPEEPTDESTEEPTDEPSLEILMTTTHSAPTRAFMPDTKRRRRRSSATTSSLATYHFQFPLVTTTHLALMAREETFARVCSRVLLLRYASEARLTAWFHGPGRAK
jgi:hypothetical protein